MWFYYIIFFVASIIVCSIIVTIIEVSFPYQSTEVDKEDTNETLDEENWIE